jgi:uncharacterized protein YfiM (DUF2279 family)
MLQTILLTTLLASSAPQVPDPWFAEDKLKHFFTSFVVTSLAASGARAAGLDRGPATAAGAGVGVAAGLYKEVRDRRAGDFFSVRDLLWDIAGVGSAAAVLESSR